MSKPLVVLASVAGACAIAVARYLFVRLAVEHFEQSRREGVSPSLKSWLSIGLLQPVLAHLGRVLHPLITWNQRRILSGLLERAGLQHFDYVQVFVLQALLSVLALCALCLRVTLGLAEDLFTRFELSVWGVGGVCALASCWWLPIFWLKRLYRQRLASIERSLPFFLDMVGLGLAAGQNLQAALQMASERLRPGALKTEWQHTLTDIRSGLARAQALRQLSARIELTALRQLLAALIQGEALGLGMAHIIEVYGAQQRAQRLMAAEKRALQAPVKMLFPLALFIFPCTFLILGFPVVVQLFGLHE